MPHRRPFALVPLLAGPALLLALTTGPIRDAPAGESRMQLTEFLTRGLLEPRQPMSELQDYLEDRIPRVPAAGSAREWTRTADRIRRNVLDRIVFRGEAARWRDAKVRVEWLESIPGGPGYRIRKLRYEALPGLWIPALLYEPEQMNGRVPVVLNVNGHDGDGKAAGYKQIRCINQARRGMLALNVEWLGMGQLRLPGFQHYRMNQLDLCGTSGLAPFYLSMQRGLDVLLSRENADPERVAVSGLSGGGWQTIFISALDTRVRLANPVAGYSSFRTRIRHLKDLGDSEQTPCDLATVADYTHLTAMMAPRPTLLTYNSKDNCCFEAGYALPPLMEAASPVYRLFDREAALRSHVNDDPGTHNFEIDNRQALYRMLGDHFYAGQPFDAREIPCAEEVKSKEQLMVELPADNLDFNSLALSIGEKLPRRPPPPAGGEGLRRWQESARERLRRTVRAASFRVKAEEAGREERGGTAATFWKIRVGGTWTVPAVELAPRNPSGTTILLADTGRRGAAAETAALLAAGRRVLAVDPFYFGESRIEQRDFLFALLLAATGERPLGLQASQVAAIARWARSRWKGEPVPVLAVGPRTSLIALVAAGLEPRAIGELELRGGLRSLKELLRQNRSLDQMPEMFCFGLLEEFDVDHLAALASPRQVRFASGGAGDEAGSGVESGAACGGCP